MPHPIRQRRSGPLTALPMMTPRRCLLAAAAFFVLTVCLGAVPGKASAFAEMIPDKLLHFVAYAILSCLLYGAVAGSRMVRAFRTFFLIASLGALDEAIQWHMPYRNANLVDWKFDMLAAVSSVAFMTLLHPVSAAPAKQRRNGSAKRGTKN
jgi:VanZ family protein